ncbi:MAG: peptide-methionine (S)-S-oxide reductase MsrA [Candidatus Thorarchaeota archaeon]
MGIATFGTGCFWCTEAVFQQLKGVKSVISGFSGGHVENPSYEQVITGMTGHAEVCQIEFDPDQISFENLLEIFFDTHDPTTPNRQGNDHGPQYRSAIFYHTEEQRETAERVKRENDASGNWKSSIVTEITAYNKFYPAKAYHQNYFKDNPNQGYCRYVIAPKLQNFEKVFKLKLDK